MHTPMYEEHVALGGTIVDFGGWDLPVQYPAGIKEEHQTVRTKAGLFDVSHMGEFWVTGPDALKFVQNLVTNDVSTMVDGQVQYNLMCYPDGGVVDDLLVYRASEDRILLVVNASNVDKDFAWVKDHVVGDVQLENASMKTAEVAFQGPLAETILQRLTDTDLSSIPFFFFKENVTVAGVPALVSRTGYTGEDGFEVYVDWDKGPVVWRAILEAGKDDGVLPIGLGARDSLRFEAGLPLYGHEIDKDITPLEAGLGFFVKLDVDDFIGAEPLRAMKAQGLPRVTLALKMVDKGVPRHGYSVFSNGEEVGRVTTGGYSPTLEENIATVLIKQGVAQVGGHLDIMVRGKAKKAVVVKKPYYKKNYKK
ncbi:MAG: glycine cleavage system protein T [Dethiosulfovibrio peptidovorans]|nr:MAG: glycine cleavage system protein T [Dethiosulfovibrio peptidovorans]